MKDPFKYCDLEITKVKDATLHRMNGYETIFPRVEAMSKAISQLQKMVIELRERLDKYEGKRGLVLIFWGISLL